MLYKVMRFAFMLALLFPLTALAPRTGRMQVISDVTDFYDIQLRMKVPVIIDNMDSLGSRKFKRQLIRGTLAVHYYTNKEGDLETEFSIPALTNLSYKIRGNYVTYETAINEMPVWVAIGSNKTGVFNRSCFAAAIEANPSYNVGDDEPDNTLIQTISCYGKQFGSFVGYAAGQLGCGCRAYGHVSPTRQLGPQGATEQVRDIASCFGTFRMKWIGYEVD